MQPNKIVASRLQYPFYMSFEQKGERCIMRNGVAYDQQLKRIPDQFVQDVLKGLNYLDGYIEWFGDNHFVYYVTDITDSDQPYETRIGRLRDWYYHRVNKNVRNHIEIVPVYHVLDKHHFKQLLHQFEDQIETYVNVIYPKSLYVWRKSTDQEGSYLKVNTKRLLRR